MGPLGGRFRVHSGHDRQGPQGGVAARLAPPLPDPAEASHPAAFAVPLSSVTGPRTPPPRRTPLLTHPVPIPCQPYRPPSRPQSPWLGVLGRPRPLRVARPLARPTLLRLARGADGACRLRPRPHVRLLPGVGPLSLLRLVRAGCGHAADARHAPRHHTQVRVRARGLYQLVESHARPLRALAVTRRPPSAAVRV